MAFLDLDRADKSKYGQFLESLKVQNSLGNDQNPEAVDEAHSILCVQKIKSNYKQRSEKQGETSRAVHDKSYKSEDDGSRKSFGQRYKHTMTCYCCGKKGHAAPECRDKDKIPRKKWFLNRAMSNLQESGATDNAEEKQEQKASSGKKGWSGFQQQSSQCHTTTVTFEDDLQNVIILDTGSTIGATFINSKLLSDIKKTEIIKIRLRPLRALVPWQTTLPGSQVSEAITN
jgi:hypothetical protein